MDKGWNVWRRRKDKILSLVHKKELREIKKQENDE